MSRFSQAEAEAAGWVIVHKRKEFEVTVGPNLVQKTPATIVAEKYVSLPGQVGRFVHEEAETMGKLLERIHAYETHLENVDAHGHNTEPVPVDTSAELPTFSLLEGEDAPEGLGDPVQSVVVPADPGDLDIDADAVTITDAEWSARSKADVLVTDEGQITYGGGGDAVSDAEEARLLNKKAIEDRRAAEPAHGPAEQVEFDTAGIADTPGIGAGGVLVVREGEGPGDVVARKEELKKMREEGRVASANAQGDAYAPEGADKLAGVDVGIQERGDLGSEIPGAGMIARTLEEPEDEGDENPAPHLYPEGEPAVSDPPEVPAHEAEQEARSEAEEAEAKEQRDESLADAESDEANAEVREAGIEAAEDKHDEIVEEAKDADSGEDELEPQAEPGEQDGDESGNDEPAPAAVDAEATPEEVAADEAGELDATKPEDEEPADAFTEKDDIDATDAAKAKAKELEVDLSKVKGSGKEGRVTAPDVEAAAEKKSE